MSGIGLDELEKQRASMVEQRRAALIVAEQAQGGIAVLDHMIELVKTDRAVEMAEEAKAAAAAKRKRLRQRKKAGVPAATNGAEHASGPTGATGEAERA